MALADARPLLFDVERFGKLIATGVLGEDERLELLDGVIVEMSPIGDRHAFALRAITRFFYALALEGLAEVAVQDPCRLDNTSQPQPDLMLLRPRPSGYERHPGPAYILLLVEVADTTLAIDRDVKGKLYAQSGVAEYWIVDLAAAAVEARRDPISAEGRYRSVDRFRRGESVAPLAFPDLAMPVERALG
jgi:Uma2 family endonuclease